jgi:hypothetical protein
VAHAAVVVVTAAADIVAATVAVLSDFPNLRRY